jgi:hypothetical protein
MVKTALVNGRTVETTGPQAHPFRCTECSACYREHRHAAKCCNAASEDLRTGDIRDCDLLALREEQIMAYEQYMADIEAKYHFECSCGEGFASIADAINCRKCRVYTLEGRCTQVTDRALDHKVVWTGSPTPVLADEETGTDASPLTHNPFSSLVLR